MKGLREAPTYRPTAQEFADPLRYIAHIRKEAESFGVCKIVPPKGWGGAFVHQPNTLRFPTKQQELGKLAGDQRLEAGFSEALRIFLFARGRPLDKALRGRILLEDKPVPLFRLLKGCRRRGGAANASQAGAWPAIATECGFAQANAAALRDIYEKYLAEYDSAVGGQGAAAVAGPPATPPPREIEVPDPPLRVGVTMWRYFQDDDRCLYGVVRVFRPPHNYALVEYYETAAAAAEAVASGGKSLCRETLPRAQLLSLVTNGASPAQARLAFDGECCEACGSAALADAMALCSRCDCHYHPECFEPPLVLVSGVEWFCPDCTEAADVGDYAKLAAGEIAAPPPPRQNAKRGPSKAPKPTNTAKGGRALKFGFADGGIFTLKEFAAEGDRWREEYLKERGLRGASEAQLEEEFWKLVGPDPPKKGVTVLYGSDLDTSVVGSGFPCCKSDLRHEPAKPLRSRGSSRSAAGTAGGGFSTPGSALWRQRQQQQQSQRGLDWNLNRLPTTAGSLLQHVGGNIKGVVVPWLYVGSAFSAFCWHNEDHYLYSINYLHWGAPKRWYGVPGSEAEAFERALEGMFPELFAAHPDLLLQLVTTANPAELVRRGVSVSACTQRQGEFVITFPQAYHAGFNMGVNCAEAVNFAPPDWLPYGRAAQERYRDFTRTPVFSHDALVMALAAAVSQRIAANAAETAAALSLARTSSGRGRREDGGVAGAFAAVAAIAGEDDMDEDGEEGDERGGAPSTSRSRSRSSGRSPRGWKAPGVRSVEEEEAARKQAAAPFASSAASSDAPTKLQLQLPPLDILLPAVATELRAVVERQRDLRQRAEEAGCASFEPMARLFDRINHHRDSRTRACGRTSPSPLAAAVEASGGGTGRKYSNGSSGNAGGGSGGGSSGAASEAVAVGGLRCGVCQQYCHMAVVVCEVCVASKGIGLRRMACAAHLTQLCHDPSHKFTVYCRTDTEQLAAQAHELEKAAANLAEGQAVAAKVAEDLESYKCVAEAVAEGASSKDDLLQLLSAATAGQQGQGGSSKGGSNKQKKLNGSRSGFDGDCGSSGSWQEMLAAWEERPTLPRLVELAALCKQQRAEPRLLKAIRETAAESEAWATVASRLLDAVAGAAAAAAAAAASPAPAAAADIHTATAVLKDEEEEGDQGGKSLHGQAAADAAAAAASAPAHDIRRGARLRIPSPRAGSRDMRGARPAVVAAQAATDAAASRQAARATAAGVAVAKGAAAEEVTSFARVATCLLMGLRLPMKMPEQVAALATALAAAVQLRRRVCALLGLQTPPEVEALEPLLARLCSDAPASASGADAAPAAPATRKWPAAGAVSPRGARRNYCAAASTTMACIAAAGPAAARSPRSASAKAAAAAAATALAPQAASGQRKGQGWRLLASEVAAATELLPAALAAPICLPETSLLQEAVVAARRLNSPSRGSFKPATGKRSLADREGAEVPALQLQVRGGVLSGSARKVRRCSSV